jgi:formiminotetrahydrofolate cyclodeaminase
MVCNLTVGKTKYVAVQDEIGALLAKSESLRSEMADLLEADVKAYGELSRTMKLPRLTEEQKKARDTAMDRALKAAAEVPMRVAEACVSVMELCRPAAEKGNINAVSDAGVAVLMAEAGLRSAALNVLINLAQIKDDAFVKEARTRLDALLEGKSALREEIYGLVVKKL